MLEDRRFLIFSRNSKRYLLLLLLVSQFANSAISAFSYSDENYLHSQESEKPKDKEGKNAFDYEEVKYIVKHTPQSCFIDGEAINIFYKYKALLEVTHALDSPPPEIA